MREKMSSGPDILIMYRSSKPPGPGGVLPFGRNSSVYPP